MQPRTMAHSSLTRLERIKDRFGGPFPARKLAALTELARRRLRTAAQVERLHEALCFVRAYPDDARVRALAARMLERFANRSDLRRHREALAHSGIAGTRLWFPFFFPTAVWLARRWPEQLCFDRNDVQAEEALAEALPLLVTPLEAAALRETKLPGYAAIDRVRPRSESDAAFLVRRVLALPGDEATRERFYDTINPSCELAPGPGVPSRTLAHFPGAPVALRTEPMRRARPDLRAACARAPRAVHELADGQGRRALALARGAMVTRQRDLDAFAYGDPRGVLLVDDGDGLAFLFNGVLPARRAPIAALFGGLTLQDGVPIGYIQADCVGRSLALSFNTFPTFRGGESAFTFSRLLAALLHVFGATVFSIEPYQLGAGNEEGIASGAWWFYFKLGFRPNDAATSRLAGSELARMRGDPGYRSGPGTLRRLAQHHLFFSVDPDEAAILPPLAELGWQVARTLGGRAGALRERAVASLERAALARTGQRSLRGFAADERRVWSQWAPLLALLPLERWTARERSDLVELVRAKAGASERGFVARLAAHERLQRDLWRVAVRRNVARAPRPRASHR